MSHHAHDERRADQQVLESLEVLASELDPPPAHVVTAARSAFRWRRGEEVLADLVYDSWLDDRALAGVRSSHGPRRLTFEAPDLRLEVEVEVVDGGSCQLVGHLDPPRPGVVQLRHASRSFSVVVDQLGRFSVPNLPPGHVSLRCCAEGVAPVDTAWMVAC